MSMLMTLLVLAELAAAPAGATGNGSAPDYATQVAPIFQQYCAGCHNDDDREGKFSLETYASLQRGTGHGPAFLPGDAGGSLLLRVLNGGAKPKMPPKDEPRPGPDELSIIEAWIAAVARGPKGQEPDRLRLIVPKIAATNRTRPVTALDATRDGRWIAVARGAELGLYASRTPRDGAPDRILGTFSGKINALHFTPDGERLVTASGVAGLGGVASVWNVADGSLVRQFQGHRDIMYDAELSPDGKILATCSYDKMIVLWDASTGQSLRALEGHTGAVYDVGFSPDGRFLVSASADDTCKVWRVTDGHRMDTLPQPLKAEYACAFSPDGRSIVAGGADNNLRVWRFVSREKPEINPMVIARFAHEGAIVKLAFSPDGRALVSTAEDRTVKAWRTSDYSELRLWENQPDVASSIAFEASGTRFEVGRMDGSIASYALPDAGLAGSGSSGSESEPFVVRVASVDPPDPGQDPIHESSEHEPNNLPDQANPVTLPARISGSIDGNLAGLADSDFYRFHARAGQSWVFEVNASRSRSKLDSYIEVLDDHGQRARECSCKPCATPTSHSAARTTPRLTTSAYSTGKRWRSIIISMPVARLSSSGSLPAGRIRAISSIRGRGAAGATSTPHRWRMRWASRAMSFSPTRQVRSWCPMVYLCSRSIMKTTTTPTASWARIRGWYSGRRRTAITCSRSGTCVGSRARDSATRSTFVLRILISRSNLSARTRPCRPGARRSSSSRRIGSTATTVRSGSISAAFRPVFMSVLPS